MAQREKREGGRASARPSILQRIRPIACAILAALCVVATLYLQDHHTFDADILSLLPPIYRDRAVEAAMKQHATQVGERIVILVSGTPATHTEARVEEIASRLRASPLFRDVRERISTEQIARIRDLVARFPFQLFPPSSHGDLSAEGASRAIDTLKRTVFSPLGMEWLRGIAQDPLLTAPRYLSAAIGSHTSIELSNGLMQIRRGAELHYLITARLASSTLASDDHSAAIATLSGIRDEYAHNSPPTRILSAGIPFFADESARRTRTEVTTISSLTLIVVLGFLWWVFRSPRVLILAGGSLISSLLIALYVTTSILPLLGLSIMHLITIGFGSSLLGVSDDYSLHFFVTHRTTPPTDPRAPLARISSGILLGFITSFIAFAGIVFTPFPGLQQLGVLCCVGLSLAVAWVFFVFPIFAGPPTFDQRLARMAERCKGFLDRRVSARGAIIALIITLPAAISIPIIDDIRVLHRPSPALVENQRAVASILNMQEGGDALLIQGATAEEVLQREERVRIELDRLREGGSGGGYRAITQMVPSAEQQRAHQRATATLVRSHRALFSDAITQLHLPETVRSRLLSIPEEPTEIFTIDECLRNGVCEGVRDLWLTGSPNLLGSIVQLHGGYDAATLKEAVTRHPGVTVINHADAISHALALYRETAMRSTALFYLVITIFLLLRYGARQGLRALLPALIGASTALAVLHIAGVPLNVFTLFALMILLGIALDFSLFFAEEKEQVASTYLAVSLSAITTVLSFGLLAFSTTPALQSFGLVLSIGVSVAAVCAPVARSHRSGLALVALLSLGTLGCLNHLPPPTRESSPWPSEVSFSDLCPQLHTSRPVPILSRDGQEAPRVSGMLECRERDATLVVLNPFGIRVRTLVIQPGAPIQDERSPLGSSSEPANDIVRRLAGVTAAR